jgi:hypothetical protein
MIHIQSLPSKNATKSKKTCTSSLVNSLDEPLGAVPGQHTPVTNVEIGIIMSADMCIMHEI